MCCTQLAENTGCKKSSFWHHHTTLLACIYAAKEYIDNWKKNLLNTDTSSTRPHNMMNFGLLTAEICWRVWGTPSHCNGLRVLTALLHGTIVVGVSQTLRRWTKGTTYIPKGGHHVGHWPTFLVFVFFSFFSYCRLFAGTKYLGWFVYFLAFWFVYFLYRFIFIYYKYWYW